MKKQRVLQSSWSTRNFPDDLWPDVLSRLPVKSLLRCRCVSTSWRILIEDPDFARLHLARFIPNRHGNRLLVDQYRGNERERECVLRCSKTFRTISKLADLTTTPVRVRTSPRLRLVRTNIRSSNNALITLPAYDGVETWEVASSIDGLVILLVSDPWPKRSLMLLWNPSIRKVRIVPCLSEITSEMMIDEMCLGFDPLNNDYKYVRFVCKQFVLQFVAVYSMGTNYWKKIEVDLGYFPFREAVCLNGVLYAINLALPHPYKLFSFDLSTETIGSTSLPDEIRSFYGSFMHLTMADGGTKLAAVQTSHCVASMWVLQSTEEGVINNPSMWTKRYTFNHTVWCYCPRFIHLHKNGEMLLGFGPMVTFYNSETRDEKTVKTRVYVRHGFTHRA